MKKFLIACTCILSLRSYAQHNIHFILTDVSVKKADSVFLAGDFNGWDPGDKKYMLTRSSTGNWEITCSWPDGIHVYKYTRGDWNRAEANNAGDAAQNRVITTDHDTNQLDIVPAWTDSKPAMPRQHTATANVHIMDTAFYIPELKRSRRIWIYLPENYYSSKQKYPVLYMHDGQNLFDAATSGFGEWGVDEALDSLQRQTGKYCIVVGIDHGGDHRLREYNPYDNNRFGKEEGIEYTEFLVKMLKPYIDAHYRTRRSAANTAIAGSSMGGLISAYAVLKYPETFGVAGIFSPSFWIAPAMKELAAAKRENKNLRFWFYAGEKESDSMVSDMRAVKDILSSKYKTDISFNTDPDASHNEGAWRKWFPAFYKWWAKKL